LFGCRFRVDVDWLDGNAVLRLPDHRAIHAHPAACDEQFGFAARADAQFGDAFGKADGIGHGRRD
jgi:hypothetical protein